MKSPESQGGLSNTYYDPQGQVIEPVSTPIKMVEAYIRYEGNDIIHGSMYRVRTETNEATASSWKKCTIIIHD